MPTLREPDPNTSYRLGLERMFARTFPEPLSPIQLLYILSQTSQESADYLERRVGRPDMRGRIQETVRLLETAIVLEWASAGISTFDQVTGPTADMHIPGSSGKIRLKRRNMALSEHSSPLQHLRA